MFPKWQCPQCNSINIKPDYVLRLAALQQAGVVDVGKTSEPMPRCRQCGFEAEVNAMLRGEYDFEENLPTNQQSKDTGILRSTPKPLVGSDRLALFVIGGILLTLFCFAAALVAGIAIYMNQSKVKSVPSTQTAPLTTPSPRVIVSTATKVPEVRMLDPFEAQRMVEEQEIPFLAGRAVEQYTDEELNEMGTTLTYTLHLERSEPLSWGMGWCTTTKVILVQNFAHIQYTFILNGKNVPIERFVEVEYYSENMQGYCRQYYTVLTDWSPGEYLIETVITYDQPINDGWADYPAGTKTYEYHIAVNR